MRKPPEIQKMVRSNSCDGLPVYFRRYGIRKREIWRSHSRLAFPFVFLLCLFTLWWSYFPVILEMKQGVVVAINQIDSSPFNSTHMEIDVVRVATISPVTTVDTQNFTGKNITHQEKSSSERPAKKSVNDTGPVVVLSVFSSSGGSVLLFSNLLAVRLKFAFEVVLITVEMKQGGVVAITRIDHENLPFNDTHLEIAVLKEATFPPVTSVDPQNFTGKNATHQDKPPSRKESSSTISCAIR
ncbi:hypothetical protein L484_011182 [Morus notabilis]|uniref:Transmembrane protein n=1 Tax=Morus notabilis TaxID=981085 RepID=W9SKT2_9ROSA|nr:hypothetical protein L484_011182 [Morus notabilis]